MEFDKIKAMDELQFTTPCKKSLGSTKQKNDCSTLDSYVLRYSVRQMTEQDISQVIELRKEAAFYDPVSSYSALLKIDPKCILVATTENGKIIGTIGLVKVSPDSYFSCFHVIHKEYRFRGVSSGLWRQMASVWIAHNIIGNSEFHLLSSNLTIFPIVEENFTIIEYEYDTSLDYNVLPSGVTKDLFLEEYQESCLQNIIDYDFSTVGYKRTLIVTSSCQDPFSRTFVAKRENKCVGYGTIKLTIQGCGKVGPLYADDPIIAESVLKRLLSSFDLKKGLVAQTLSNNVLANAIFAGLGQPTIIPSYRVSSKRRFNVDTKNIYACLDGEYVPF